ncbi:MAG: hypothetical protein AAF352_05605 [Pseudomonadota bacterium]
MRLQITRHNDLPVRLLGAVMVCLVLSGCFLPTQFSAVMLIDDAGNYKFTYEGNAMSISLLKALADESLNADNFTEEDWAALVEREENIVKRYADEGTVAYLGGGLFTMESNFTSNINAIPYWTFPTRQGRWMSLKHDRQGNVNIRTHVANDQYRDDLNARGFRVNGRLVIRTNANVIAHNAPESVRTGSVLEMAWDFDGIPRSAAQVRLKFPPWPTNTE